MEIGNCENLTDATAKHLAQCLSLQHVAIGDLFYDGVSGSYTDTAAEVLAKLPLLKSVAICGVADLTDQAATHLAKCPKLQSVSLAACEKLTDAAVDQITKCPLRRVDGGTSANNIPPLVIPAHWSGGLSGCPWCHRFGPTRPCVFSILHGNEQ